MVDSFDRVRGVRELPLFPLPLVLFPGAPQSLHIFEPRYRQMFSDVQASNRLFGLSYFDPTSPLASEGRPHTGHVGCVAEVVESQMLPDGRSNIVAVGLVRYRVEAYIERGDPYLVGRVAFFADDPEDPQTLDDGARAVRDLFERIAQAVRTINDERAGLRELTEADPEQLSFLVASTLEIESETKQELLELRSTSERLMRLKRMLAQVVESYEERARMHALAKGNGHGGKHINFDS
ncbi:MAG TPA: LON peptidase substrate-binding domain-containing protein [Pyrinomonadaceae bacterium]|nr:LON peptidase substrate-binding domain-containing protein [Pyrinomonadaceae bacterium]